jgi:mRNA-degrading endonuclease RelE of RelBE toxin-antitoxin system
MMEFRISDTFSDSLPKLNREEQRAVKTTAFDLQLNPANPGFSFHKLDRARDKNFWSVRVNRDVRIIVHKTKKSLLLCYVDHHDQAYKWAERRKLETHPKTGAAQLVEIRETVQEVRVPVYVEARTTPGRDKKRFPFDGFSEEDLLKYGVPEDWINDVKAADEESLLELTDHLPAEAAEALLELATGGTPRIPESITTDPFEHPDAQRRFRVMTDVDELTRALDFPWDKWTVFLHPEQRQLVEKTFNGPARVSGSAGTGKTIVALHRAVFLARSNPDSRVLLTTFSDPLANSLKSRLHRLVSTEPRLAERIDVHSLTAIAKRLYKMHLGETKIVDKETIAEFLLETSREVPDHKFSLSFLMAEWFQIVDSWQLLSWESYRDIPRLGRKTRLPEKHRAKLWSIFESVIRNLAASNLVTEASMFTQLANVYGTGKAPFEFIVVDESQDVGVPQMKFLAAAGADYENGLFFAGDLGQRIFQQPFSWKSLGVDIRGRSRKLRVNYRTSHQIRSQADLLLGPSVSDLDGNKEDRTDTVSVFNGPPPAFQVCDSQSLESDHVATWMKSRVEAGFKPHEFGVFVRSEDQVERAVEAIKSAGLKHTILDERSDSRTGYVSLCTMHLAKGLEFRAVVVMACDDEVLPLQQRIEQVGDDADLQEVYDTERHLFYVACTRARDQLLVTSVDPCSEFLDDMQIN